MKRAQRCMTANQIAAAVSGELTAPIRDAVLRVYEESLTQDLCALIDADVKLMHAEDAARAANLTAQGDDDGNHRRTGKPPVSRRPRRD